MKKQREIKDERARENEQGSGGQELKIIAATEALEAAEGD